ncbi:22300_t:CDS:2 [Cetraspora pellucida]|uniref:22300_t:CDS:1 n=1 Tax=Cetraspora pellucida TaxID=1433469 RepID=A0A9N9HQT3_9GLOM|nr:22300_t:CDS:2 [Cetraspora pellucida]
MSVPLVMSHEKKRALYISICPPDGEDVLKEIAKALRKNTTLTYTLEKIQKKIRKDIDIALQYDK